MDDFEDSDFGEDDIEIEEDDDALSFNCSADGDDEDDEEQSAPTEDETEDGSDVVPMAEPTVDFSTDANPERLDNFIFMNELNALIGRRADMLGYGAKTTLPHYVMDSIDMGPRWPLSVAIAEYSLKRLPLKFVRPGRVEVDPNTATPMRDPWKWSYVFIERAHLRAIKSFH